VLQNRHRLRLPGGSGARRAQSRTPSPYAATGSARRLDCVSAACSF
jgi:hypothetical protein